MIECRYCLYKDNHPLGLLVDANGLCSGCRVHLEKNEIDWLERRQDLHDLVKNYRRNEKYECIVPVSGGQDSFYIVHYIVNELGLKPLLVNFNRVFNSREGIYNLQRLRSVFGLDLNQSTLNPSVVRKVIQTTLANLGTVNWFWIAGQTSLPVRLARDLEIPLIIWGAHQGLEQVGMFSHLDNVEMTRRYREEHDLLGVDEEAIFNFDCAFSKEDIIQLTYPSDDEILKSEIRGIYLGNYVRWDPYAQHELVSKTYGYRGRISVRSYYEFDNPDCAAYMSIQDELKQIKFGYAKVTDQLCREIRHGRISRDEAFRINREFLAKSDHSSIRYFMNWLGANPRSFELLKLNFSNNFGSAFRDLLDKESSFFQDSEELEDQDYDVFGKGLFNF